MKHSLRIDSNGKAVRGVKIQTASPLNETQGMLINVYVQSGIADNYIYRGDQWYRIQQP